MKLFVAVVAACAIFTVRSGAQNARLIGLDVQAIDTRTGKTAELLGPDDFEVYADGQRVPIRRLDIDTPPMDLVFVIYLSNPGLSTAPERKGYIQGLEAAVAALRPGDRAGVIRGGQPRDAALPLSTDSAAIRQALLGGRQQEKYRLFDAVARGLSLFSRQASLTRRRAIIAITDDVERNSETGADALQEDLLTEGVTLHEVMLALTRAGSRINIGGPPLPFPKISGNAGRGGLSGGGSLVGIVRATGGENVIGDDFDSALPALISRLRLRYTLTVAVPAAARGFHKVEVRLTPGKLAEFPGVIVRNGIGYYSGP